MEIIKPTSITLIATNATDESYSTWDSNTSYAINDTVIYNYVIYTALTANTNKQPDLYPTDWQKINAVNSRRMFDEYIGTQTTRTNGLTVTVNANMTNSIALFNTNAYEVMLTLKQNGNTVWTTTISLYNHNANDWWEYFFGERLIDTSLMCKYPLLPDTELTIQLNTQLDTDIAACGNCIVGRSRSIGASLYTPTVEILDYSRKITDDFGRTTISQGNWAKKISVDLFLHNTNVDTTHKVISELRGTPIVWNINNESTDYEILLVYGFYNSFQLNMQSSQWSNYTLDIQGLI